MFTRSTCAASLSLLLVWTIQIEDPERSGNTLRWAGNPGRVMLLEGRSIIGSLLKSASGRKKTVWLVTAIISPCVVSITSSRGPKQVMMFERIYLHHLLGKVQYGKAGAVWFCGNQFAGKGIFRPFKWHNDGRRDWDGREGWSELSRLGCCS